MKNVILSVALVALSGLGSVSASEHGALCDSIGQFVAGFKAETGVAVMLPDGDTLSVNNNRRYPMLSVVKLPLGMAVADMMERRRLPLDTEVEVAKADLLPDTYSPLRDARPNGGFQMTVEELLNYSLQLSDNNACDILFRFVGGTAVVERYVHSIGVQECNIRCTEEQMHFHPDDCYLNYSTPLAAVRLLNVLGEEAKERPLFGHVMQTIGACETGLNRIPHPLADTGAVVYHKTGTGGYNARGQLVAVNDIGIVELPGGITYTLAVFVKDSSESPETTESIIAGVSKIVYDYVIENNKKY